MTEQGNPNETLYCKFCRELGDPKLYLGLAVVVLATWDNLPQYVLDNEWSKYVHSVLLFTFGGAGIALRRPKVPPISGETK